MADKPDRAAVMALLEQVKDPRSGHGLVSAGLVQGLVVAADRVGFMLEVDADAGALYAPVAQAAEQMLRARLPGLDRVQVVVTADRAPGAGPARTVERKGASAPPQAAAPTKPANVRHVLAVASGKGGVGKSSVAVNLACAFAVQGWRVGLLDADVYGPSAPLMMGVSGHPAKRPDGKIEPLVAHGVRVMSIGFMVDEGQAMIWRGPMASGAVTQMLNDVAWADADAPLDVLVIDMPPGTGDVQLTIAQRVALSGAVVVSTPQEAALADVRRGLSMFDKTRTPVLGIVENMAYFPDPATGAPIAIFGRGGARATAQALGAPFLGEIPIDLKLREACDAGAPLVVAQPAEPTAIAFAAIAHDVAARLERSEGLKPAPKILIER